MKQELTPKQQLASGTITVSWHHKGAYKEKQVDVPERLFDLATRTDEMIFENCLDLYEPFTIKEMSDCLFEGLLNKLRAKNRPVGRIKEELKKYSPEVIKKLVKAIQE